MNHDEMLRCIYHVFHPSLPRLGPGDSRFTRKAIETLRPLLGSKPLNILDLGCGNGTQTLCLADSLPGRITAMDTHQPFLDELNRRAKPAGLSEKIETRCLDMGSSDLPSGAFDLVWCEGALYNLGLEAGLRQGLRLLRQGGCMAFTELCWLSDKRSAACQDFFNRDQLNVIDVAANLAVIREVGFKEIGHFALPAESWWTDYYRPLQRRLVELKDEAARDENLAEIIRGLEAEIDLFLTHHEEYGYVFYLLQKP
jgi:SAM-dependent methyltransferase